MGGAYCSIPFLFIPPAWLFIWNVSNIAPFIAVLALPIHLCRCQIIPHLHCFLDAYCIKVKLFCLSLHTLQQSSCSLPLLLSLHSTHKDPPP